MHTLAYYWMAMFLAYYAQVALLLLDEYGNPVCVLSWCSFLWFHYKAIYDCWMNMMLRFVCFHSIIKYSSNKVTGKFTAKLFLFHNLNPLQ